MTRRQERRRLRDANSPLDEHGVLKDGHTLRVSLMDATAARGRSPAAGTANDRARQITEAVVATQLALMKGDGSRENPFIIGRAQLSDAEAALHRPGFRNDTTTEEEEHTHRRRKVTYKDPLGRETGSSETDDALAGLSPSERARAERMIADSNAWRGDATLPNQGAATRALQEVPSPGGRFPPEAEGQSCDLDGRRGIVKNACHPLPAIGPTRADSMIAAEAQPARDQAYQSYLDDLHSAWR
jgi:hypothetical protein